ncbi:MAG: A/G-specific adenine glycosylase [Acetobacteraceae bacterium]|jgi:A/G-specific adenine glycosylase|nr:A/G-specific adenine glycosylase [Rubritepida sp.]MCU0984559.1 A/G-specific adenine glycosylase [Acetobacteraceae bacterium]
MPENTSTDETASRLLAWYDRHRRELPWRARPGEKPDPYAVWLSEIMLQQTTVAAVGPRYRDFLARFPDVAALAAAPWEEVAQAWAGLGYYARARNLHAAAQAVAARGAFPEDEAGLRALPGIGAYTAAAVAAIAFGRPAVPVDGNVERVMARLFAVTVPLPSAKPLLTAHARRVGEAAEARARPGDFAQGLFDLGATICTPRRPACALCPLRQGCAAQREGIAEGLPAKAPRRAQPQRHGAVFWLEDEAGRVLLRRRPPEGLLGGMLGLPGTPWRDAPWDEAEALAHAPAEAAWRPLGLVRHVFTHFALDLSVLAARIDVLPGEGVARAAVLEAGLPAVMAKAAKLALADQSSGRSLARSTSSGRRRPRSS